MSTTATLVEPPVKLEKKAQVFVVAVDEQAPHTDEEKEALAKTFLLNSKDFIDFRSTSSPEASCHLQASSLKPSTRGQA